MSEKMYQGLIGVLVLVILIGGAVMLGMKKSSSLSTNDDTGVNLMVDQKSDDATTGDAVKGEVVATPSVTKQVTVSSGNDEVTIGDQTAGDAVQVAKLSLSKNGWVAIEEDGWTLGAAWFPAGDRQDVEVPLLRATKAGQSYKAVLYYDAGEDHQFDIHTDTLVVKADGSAVSAAFLAK